MPRNKREGIFFGVMMALVMSLFMNFFNTFRHAGISTDAVLHALMLEPVILLIVIIVQDFVISKPIAKVSARLVHEDDSQAAKGLARAVSTVTAMSLIMTAIGLILGGTPAGQIPLQFLALWPVNFCAAFFCQRLIAMPLSLGALKALRSL